MRNVCNFSASPAVWPESGLQETADEALDYRAYIPDCSDLGISPDWIIYMCERKTKEERKKICYAYSKKSERGKAYMAVRKMERTAYDVEEIYFTEEDT